MAQTHVRRTEQQWREIFARYESSSDTQSAFCKAEGIALASFMRWRDQLGLTVAKRRAAPSRSTSPAVSPFVELTPASSGKAWSIELELPGGCVLRVRP